MRYQHDNKHTRSVYFLSRTLKQSCPFLNTPCMIWQGATANGYPIAKVFGKFVQVRRYVYNALSGSAPGQLKSICAQPLCLNPAHQAT